MGINNLWSRTSEADMDMSSMTFSPKLFPGKGLDMSGGSIESYNESEVNDLVKQNIKMILLTAPGERMMITNFGVGLRNYLFQMPTQRVFSEIKARAKTQLSQYSPPISIQNMEVSFEGETLYFKMDYIVSLTQVTDSIEVEVTA
jgi:phage baseplate assembly protein W